MRSSRIGQYFHWDQRQTLDDAGRRAALGGSCLKNTVVAPCKQAIIKSITPPNTLHICHRSAWPCHAGGRATTSEQLPEMKIKAQQSSSMGGGGGDREEKVKSLLPCIPGESCRRSCTLQTRLIKVNNGGTSAQTNCLLFTERLKVQRRCRNPTSFHPDRAENMSQ